MMVVRERGSHPSMKRGSQSRSEGRRPSEHSTGHPHGRYRTRAHRALSSYHFGEWHGSHSVRQHFLQVSSRLTNVTVTKPVSLPFFVSRYCGSPHKQASRKASIGHAVRAHTNRGQLSGQLIAERTLRCPCPCPLRIQSSSGQETGGPNKYRSDRNTTQNVGHATEYGALVRHAPYTDARCPLPVARCPLPVA